MKPTTLERLMQHLLPMPNSSENCVRDCVRDCVETASGTRLSVQASRFHYCLPRDDMGPYTHVEVEHPDAPEEWVPRCSWKPVYAYVPIEVVAAEIDRLGGFAEEQP